MKIILASASPRRKELLKNIIENFECIPSDIDETVPENIPLLSGPEYLAVKKAKFLSEKYKDSIIIGADTTVFIDNRALGKPLDKADAVNMLSLLSGRTHTVITGCALFYNGISISFSNSTDVEFYPLDSCLIQEYVRSGEPLDKAGAYGIQDKGCLFVKKIAGDYYNVMGMPVSELYRKLNKFKELIK